MFLNTLATDLPLPEDAVEQAVQMTGGQSFLVCAFLILSLVIAAIPFLYLAVCQIPEIKKRRFSRGMNWILFSVCLLGSVWCLRFSVGCYTIFIAPADEVTLNVAEEIFNSIAHALQTVSMDEDYTEYIVNGRKMLQSITGGSSFFDLAYGFYASLLNFIAPIAGGAIIFEILASVFPRFNLWKSYLSAWREKLYFSELNEQSLALMKSLLASWDKPHRPVVIFTDAYEDKEDEKRTELMMEAKLSGAICIKDDLAHIPKPKKAARTFYLMDESELGNLQTLVDLSDERNHEYLRGSEIYLFCYGNLYSQVERQVLGRLRADYGWEEEDLPLITPVQSYRNLVSNLLVDLPLYEPLVEAPSKSKNTNEVTPASETTEKQKKDPKDLNVTILGNGIIGTEMFLAVYWFGQMLDHKLKINVVSKDSAKEFWEKIDYINPEIKQTVEVHLPPEEEEPGTEKTAKTVSAEPPKKDDILRYRPEDDSAGLDDEGFADYYADVTYLPSDVKNGTFWKMSENDSARLLDTDYFIVALGSDTDNIAIAEKIRQRIGEAHVKNGENKKKKTVIAYVVYDSDLCEMLNRQKRYSSVSAEADIYMHAFGSMKEVYSRGNILMTKASVLAKGVGSGYKAAQEKADHQRDSKKFQRKGQSVNEDRDYTSWADRARAMHLKYKVYSLGWIESSVFITADESDHREAVEKACLDYKCALFDSQYNGTKRQKLEDERDRLAYLEHRRWNAFTRIRGFRQTGDYCTYSAASGGYKHMSLKLHPCLVECDQIGIRDGLLKNPPSDLSELDYLDRLSLTLDQAHLNDYDFKTYDYPEYEFDLYLDEEAAAVKLNITAAEVRKNCEDGKYDGAFRPKDGRWLIPVSKANDYLTLKEVAEEWWDLAEDEVLNLSGDPRFKEHLKIHSESQKHILPKKVVKGYLTVRSAARQLRLETDEEKNMIAYCANRKFDGAFQTPSGRWLIPANTVNDHRILKKTEKMKKTEETLWDESCEALLQLCADKKFPGAVEMGKDLWRIPDCKTPKDAAKELGIAEEDLLAKCTAENFPGIVTVAPGRLLIPQRDLKDFEDREKKNEASDLPALKKKYRALQKKEARRKKRESKRQARQAEREKKRNERAEMQKEKEAKRKKKKAASAKK